MESLARDIRYSLRTMRKNPGFVAVALLTIALGIGANTAIFSIVNAVMLRPLPYSDAARLAGVWGTHVQKRGQSLLSPAAFLDCKSQTQVFEQVEGIEQGNGTTLNLITPSGPVRVKGARVSAGLFSMLGVEALADAQRILQGRREDSHDRMHVAVQRDGFADPLSVAAEALPPNAIAQ